MLHALNHRFTDRLSDGMIHPGESVDDAGRLYPCLKLRLDRRRVGRLYQFIAELNNLDLPASAALDHPGERRVQPIGRR